MDSYLRLVLDASVVDLDVEALRELTGFFVYELQGKFEEAPALAH